jgi:uncharacterized protein YraI
MAVVTADRVNIRSGPGTGYPVSTSAGEGSRLEILDETGDWYRVKMPRMGQGWVYKPLVTVIR